jgi:cell division protein FtsW (lipid II flippase)
MALPFFTYGGTNLLCTFFAIGTILSVGIHSLDAKKRAFLRKVVLK